MTDLVCRGIVIIVLAVGCGPGPTPYNGSAGTPRSIIPDAGTNGTTDGGPADAGISSDDIFRIAPHSPFPALTFHKGLVLSSVKLVTITFANYEYASDVEALGDFLVGSDWMTAAGKDYGVGFGTHLAKVRLDEPAPTTISDVQLQKKIVDWIAAGTVPPPEANANQVLYLVYFPSTTTVLDEASDPLCTGPLDGYHSTVKANHDGTKYTIPYGVIAHCPQETSTNAQVTVLASHEFIEACTDPTVTPTSGTGWFLDTPDTDSWPTNLEDADLCERDHLRLGGFELTRAFSNSAAAQGISPCVPAVPGEIYFNVTADPTTKLQLAPGATAQVTLTGWSTGPRNAWDLSTEIVGQFELQASLSASKIKNATTVTLTLTVPQSAMSGAEAVAKVWSGPVDFPTRYWPVGVRVK